MRRVLLVACLLVGSVLVASPVKAAERTVDLDYDVELLSADEGTYRIEARFAGLDDGDVISKFTFHWDRYGQQYGGCTNLTVDSQSYDDCTSPVEDVDVNGDTLTYSFEANLDQQASGGGYNSRTEPTWAVLQASGVGFAFSYTHPSSVTPVFEPTLAFDLPEDWDADASFPKDSGRFQLEHQFPRPAGIVVLGEFERTSFEVAGHDAVIAEVEPASEDVQHLIEATAPHLESTHGDAPGPKVLFVSAPGPFKEGGVATRDGFAISEDAPAQTVVHEWVHLYQRYEICNRLPGQDCDPRGTVTDETGASVWIKEGGAEYYSARALYASGEWSVSRTQEFFDRVRDRYEEAPLDEAVYGSSVERAAYTKGALTLARADETLRETSGNTVDLGTVMRELNADVRAEMAGDSPRDITETNADFQSRLDDHVDHDWASFFDDYVESEEDPGSYTFDPTGSFRFSDLRVRPDPVVAGGDLQIGIDVTNAGLEADETTFRFFVDGRVVANRTVSLDAGESTRAKAVTTAPDPGEIVVEAATLRRDVTVHAPADLSLAGIDPRPTRPEADTPYAVEVAVANEGGVPGNGTVALTVGNASLGSQDLTVEGDGTRTTRFINVTSPEGQTRARAELTFEGTTTSMEASWEVQPRAVLDSDTLREVPGPGIAVAAAAVSLAAVALRKR